MKKYIKKILEHPIISSISPFAITTPIIVGIGVLVIWSLITFIIPGGWEQVFKFIGKIFVWLGSKSEINNWFLLILIALSGVFLFGVVIFFITVAEKKAVLQKIKEYNLLIIVKKQIQKSLRKIKRERSKDTIQKQVKVEYRVIKNNSGKYILTTKPSDFFTSRLEKSFPGFKGLKNFDSSQKALDRLEILLKEPLSFINETPIWWFRNSSDSSIKKFERINKTKCLINHHMELDIKKIVVFRSRFDWQNFVYVEVNGEEPSGAYKDNNETKNQMIKELGYALEEYGLYKNIPVTRSCYDDGAAEIKGKVVDISNEVKSRVRYLSNYNFIITSAFSSSNCIEFRSDSTNKLFNEIIQGNKSINDLKEFIVSLPRHPIDVNSFSI